MKIFGILFVGLLLLAVGGCQNDDENQLETIVVDGVLHVDQPFKGLKLWQLADLDQPLNIPFDADAVVIRADEDFFLMPDPTQPGSYIDPSTTLEILPQSPYQLIIVKGEELIFSGVVTPKIPESLNIEQPVYAMDAQIRSIGNFNIVWSNPQGALFFGQLALITDPITKIDNQQPDGPSFASFDIVTDNFYQIPFNTINFYGTYRFVLYAVNQEYLDFFGSGQASVKIQQVTNIVNGLGIFTAVASDTLYFQVVPN